MRNLLKIVMLAGIAVLVSAPASRAQMMPKKDEPKAPAPPAPVHDLNGVWNMRGTPEQRKYINNTWTREQPDMTAWGKAKYDAAKPSNGPRSNALTVTDDPVLSKCFPPGTPRIYMQPFPMEIVQTPKVIFMIFEYDHIVRQIFVDGRKHPDDVIPTYMGHSIGHWEDDTLVVDTVGFNEKTWLDRDGHQHSDQLHVIERFRRTDLNNLVDDITMEDPKALAKPWVSQLHFQYKPDWDIMELACPDNEAFVSFEK